jgi:hypothetical protein
MSRSRLELVGALLLSVSSMALVGCDTCEVTPLKRGRYRLEASKPEIRIRESASGGANGELLFDEDAGVVDVTRIENGRKTVERWRVVTRGRDVP